LSDIKNTSLLPFTRSRDHKKNDKGIYAYVSSNKKNGAVVREYAGYGRLAGLEEQALLAAVYTPLVRTALVAQCALYNPVLLQRHVNKAILRLRQRLAQTNRIQTQAQA
jgi:hypothetical protein